MAMANACEGDGRSWAGERNRAMAWHSRLLAEGSWSSVVSRCSLSLPPRHSQLPPVFDAKRTNQGVDRARGRCRSRYRQSQPSRPAQMGCHVGRRHGTQDRLPVSAFSPGGSRLPVLPPYPTARNVQLRTVLLCRVRACHTHWHGWTLVPCSRAHHRARLGSATTIAGTVVDVPRCLLAGA